MWRNATVGATKGFPLCLRQDLSMAHVTGPGSAFGADAGLVLRFVLFALNADSVTTR